MAWSGHTEGVTVGGWSGGEQVATLSVTGVTQTTGFTCLVTGGTGKQHPHVVTLEVTGEFRLDLILIITALHAVLTLSLRFPRPSWDLTC